jgi:predicted DNA-binding protein (MmcQ/YjbR family)
MNVDEIRKYCRAFPGVTEKLQWDDALCFKVGEKMFAVLGLDRLRLTFKCSPEDFSDLIERPDIRPSPYLGRHGWVMLERLDALRRHELKEMIRQSYKMAAAKGRNTPTKVKKKIRARKT